MAFLFLALSVFSHQYSPLREVIAFLMGDIELFAHDDSIYLPELLKIALIHYQFETIHPFLDGNGRVGRLMITLYLVSKGILKAPILYLSDFFEKNRGLYYDNLMRVREKDDLVRWFKFFLVGIIETARNGITTFDSILQLQRVCDEKIRTLGSRAANAQMVINALFQKPVINPAQIGAITGLSVASAYKLTADLERLGVLNEVTGGKRDKFYWFGDYIEIFK